MFEEALVLQKGRRPIALRFHQFPINRSPAVHDCVDRFGIEEDCHCLRFVTPQCCSRKRRHIRCSSQLPQGSGDELRHWIGREQPPQYGARCRTHSDEGCTSLAYELLVNDGQFREIGKQAAGSLADDRALDDVSAHCRQSKLLCPSKRVSKRLLDLVAELDTVLARAPQVRYVTAVTHRGVRLQG